MIAKKTLRTAVLFLAILPFVAQTAYADSRRGGGGRGGARHAQGRGGARYAVPAVPHRAVPYRYYGYPRRYAYPYPAYGYAPYYYGYPYGFGLSLGFGYGGIGYGGFGYGGFGYGGFGYGGYGYPYGYGYAPGGVVIPMAGRPYGAIRLDIPERHASVTVDGYLVGSVDDFDGTMQQLNLERGTHRIEIAAPGFEPAQFDVNIRSGQTITYRTPLRPQP